MEVLGAAIAMVVLAVAEATMEGVLAVAEATTEGVPVEEAMEARSPSSNSSS